VFTQEEAEEIVYNYPEEMVNAKYKELVGFLPEAGTEDVDMIKGLTHPDEERTRVINKRRQEDHDDAVRTSRGVPRKD
jgi:hypothetical protein